MPHRAIAPRIARQSGIPRAETLRVIPYLPLSPIISRGASCDRRTLSNNRAFRQTSAPHLLRLALAQGPVPVRLTLCGSGVSDIDSVADSVPNVPGLNVTVRVRAVFAARVVAQVPPVIETS
jgi:hypothetical protein